MGAKKITPSIFNCVKQLLKADTEIKEIAEYMSISTTSVWRIQSSETFEEYEHNVLVSRAKYAKKASDKLKVVEPEPQQEPEPEPKVIEHRQSVTIVANHYMAEQLQRQTELLTLISNKLAFIVDELTGPASKGG